MASIFSVLIATTCPVRTAAGVSLDTKLKEPSALMTLAMADDQPVERQIGGLTKTVFREIRRSYRLLSWMFWRSVDRWGRWIKVSAFSVGVAIVAALADGGLVNAWRVEGLRTLATYACLMLYVYGRLLFSGGVQLAPKLLLLGALIYGIVRRDLMPDRTLIPGRLDDIVLIVIATRTFVYACPEALVAEFADRAVNLKRRVLSFPRARIR
jgi:uncharacterized membrane protein YkvA (DUF1232 family)